ncbi:hypothetical protein CORC01_00313 [Colletotrichum orchidophilum]|uniref:EB domain-containing protein n=1 Tax=Colletotrichum orchidophilum TaxID=1209926 RepID=A0A1G4BSV2_9PEZI|nr:uncharacterized protein CORC01_00313 [Colletotrichum orchidophilum]OHF04461.1 hypothetical protein CORC01_00313 [Colletotrichum orchidophilum]
MKPFIVTIIGLIPLINAQACNANNCARVVTGTRAGITPDVTSRRADCSSYMRTTVIPDTFTSTITTTVYTDVIPRTSSSFSQSTSLPPSPTRVPETKLPTAVPSYATQSCTSAQAYSSACSCWGITPAVTTLPAPTVVVTTTKYAEVGCVGARDCPFEGVNLFRCGDRTTNTFCTCLRAADRNGNGGGRRPLCVENRACNEVRTCSSSSDCGLDEGCVINYCCGRRGSRICLKFAPLACVNPTLPRAIFEERLEAAKGRGGEKV